MPQGDQCYYAHGIAELQKTRRPEPRRRGIWVPISAPPRDRPLLAERGVASSVNVGGRPALTSRAWRKSWRDDAEAAEPKRIGGFRTTKAVGAPPETAHGWMPSLASRSSCKGTVALRPRAAPSYDVHPAAWYYHRRLHVREPDRGKPGGQSIKAIRQSRCRELFACGVAE
eukprot:10647461-Heterocapsa_arctica.AAC.1